MAIGRFEHPDGEFLHALEAGGYTHRAPLLIERDMGRLVILNPGARLVTPAPWVTRTNEHFLIVNEDGTGEYHKTPRKSFGKRPSIEMLENLTPGEIRYARGGDVMLLKPGANDFIPLIGPHPDHADIRLWAVTAYVPEVEAVQMVHEEPLQN